MTAFIKGDLPVPGTAFSCVSCHMQSGLGSSEGGVFTPPTNGTILYKPFRVLFKGLEQKYFPFPDRRPAYNDTTLAEVIRSGETPTGGHLNDIMPRYLLEDNDMAILISYLKSLSTQFSPGVSKMALHFATIVTDDVSPQDRAAMLAPLQLYINIKNSQARAYQRPSGRKSRLMAENMFVSKELATRTMTLSTWVLKGPPETWRAQLEEYYRTEPIFALLGGITYGDWSVIHKFSEDKQIPCILPQTDFPVISPTDWYTLYPSKGYFQEGEAAAHYLNNKDDIKSDKMIVQIVRESREGRALAAGFDQTWENTGHHAVVTIKLKPGEKITRQFIKQLPVTGKPVVFLLWDSSESLLALDILSESSTRPELVFVSARYLGRKIQLLPERSRAFTYITYPYSFARTVIYSSMGSTTVEDDSQWQTPLRNSPINNRAQGISSVTQSLTEVLTMVLMDMYGYYYRDKLLDVISMVPDQPSSIYARFSFGPNQRYASKGCYIVQLSQGSEPDLIRKSDWVIY